LGNVGYAGDTDQKQKPAVVVVVVVMVILVTAAVMIAETVFVTVNHHTSRCHFGSSASCDS